MSINWPIDWPSGEPEGVEAHIRERAETFAVTVLRMLTLNRVGGAPVTVMPCPNTCAHRGRMWIDPILVSGRVYNAACGCSTGCGCAAVPRVRLTPPVSRIEEVRVSGEVLDPTAYRVEDGTWLVRTDGDGWPPCQGEHFTVTYLNAHPVDAMGRFAAGVLAEEYIASMTGGKCRLPGGVTNITRQGITMEVATGMFPEGTTGVYEVDTFIRAWNPYAMKVASTVSSPDLQRPRQVTWRA